MNSQLWLVITIEFPKLPESVEKPALQKAEMEWKAAKAKFLFQIHPKRIVNAEPDGHHANASMTNVNSRIYSSVDSNDPNELELTISTDNELIVNGGIPHKEHGEETG